MAFGWYGRLIQQHAQEAIERFAFENILKDRDASWDVGERTPFPVA